MLGRVAWRRWRGQETRALPAALSSPDGRAGVGEASRLHTKGNGGAQVHKASETSLDSPEPLGGMEGGGVPSPLCWRDPVLLM